MFQLQKIIAAWIEIPGIFLTLLVSFGIVFRKQFSRKVKIGLACFVLFAYSLSASCLSQWLAFPLEKNIPPLVLDVEKDDFSTSAIVVLGAGVTPRVPVGMRGERGEDIPPNSLKRTHKGYELWKVTKMSVWVAGGKADASLQTSEAEIMQRALLSWGVPSEAIVLEMNSRSTEENARFVVQALERRISRIFLVTSAMHMRRAMYLFSEESRKAEKPLTIVPVPSHYTGNYGGVTLFSVLPSMEGLAMAASALHEYLGIIFYFVVSCF